MNELSADAIKYIIGRVLEYAEEVKNSDSQDPFCAGQKLAYYKTLSTLKNQLKIYGMNLSDFGLDISVEQFA